MNNLYYVLALLNMLSVNDRFYYQALLKECDEANQKIRHSENVATQYLNFFFIVIIAYGTILITGLFAYSNQINNNFYNQCHAKLILGLFCADDKLLFITITINFIVFLISIAILAVMTKTKYVVEKRRDSIKQIHSKIYSPFVEQIIKDSNMYLDKGVYAEDKLASKLLSIRYISKLFCIIWIALLLIFNWHISYLQQSNNIDILSKISLNNIYKLIEFLFLLVEVFLLYSYTYYSNFILNIDTDSSNSRQEDNNDFCCFTILQIISSILVYFIFGNLIFAIGFFITSLGLASIQMNRMEQGRY